MERPVNNKDLQTDALRKNIETFMQPVKFDNT